MTETPVDLYSIVQGQAERNILDTSIQGYISKLKTLTKIIYEREELRAHALESDDSDNILCHSGLANKVYKLKLPMQVETAKQLFALISVDTTLPRKRKISELGNNFVDEPINNVDVDTRNPSAGKVTVSAQTYQNYKSALKWWHEYDCPAMDKIGYIWPVEVDSALKKCIVAYKRDIAVKERSSIMPQSEGKSPYNFNRIHRNK